MRRNALLLPLLVAGCFSSSGSDGCGDVFSGLDLTNSGLGVGNFEYVCPPTSGQDAWCDSGDVTGAYDLTGLIGFVPTIAVGASFSFAYTDSAYANIVPAPAVPSLATPVGSAAPPTGDANAPGSAPVKFGAPGSYAFLATEPGTNPPIVRDFLDVPVAAVTSLTLAPTSATAYVNGLPVTISAIPHASDDSILAGQFTCTATSSEPSVATVVPSGDGAIVTARAVGKSVVTLSCLGVSAKATINVLVGSEDAGRDAAPDATTKDATASDALNEDAGKDDAADAANPAEDDAAIDAGADVEIDAASSDADVNGGE